MNGSPCRQCLHPDEKGLHTCQPRRLTPERLFAQELRQMFTQATEPASVGMSWVDVIRRIVEASERMADARDRERPAWFYESQSR